MSERERPVSVAVVTFAQATASTVFGMYDLFRAAGRDWGLITQGRPGPELMRSWLVARDAAPLTVVNEVRIAPHYGFADCPRPDVVCIPDLSIAPDEPLEGFDAEIEWLKRVHTGGAMLATACSGALLLAEAGLLDGQPATTHWAFCDTLARRYPRVDVQPQRALVVAGEGQRLLMAGGGTAWFDMALYVIARTCGAEAAMQVARMNLIDWHTIGQQPFASLSRTRQSEDALIGDCQAWIAQNYAVRAPVAAMVARSGLPERSFVRRFKAATGLSPIQYVHALRLEEAKQMLETGDAPIEAIAEECGYEDAGFFSRLFRSKVGLTPAQYRKRFGGMRRTLAALQA